MPQATHDEQAMEDHFLAMRMWTNRNLDPLDRRLLDDVRRPAGHPGQAERGREEVRLEAGVDLRERIGLVRHVGELRLVRGVRLHVRREHRLSAVVAVAGPVEPGATMDGAADDRARVSAFSARWISASYCSNAASILSSFSRSSEVNPRFSFLA